MARMSKPSQPRVSCPFCKSLPCIVHLQIQIQLLTLHCTVSTILLSNILTFTLETIYVCIYALQRMSVHSISMHIHYMHIAVPIQVPCDLWQFSPSGDWRNGGNAFLGVYPSLYFKFHWLIVNSVCFDWLIDCICIAIKSVCFDWLYLLQKIRLLLLVDMDLRARSAMCGISKLSSNKNTTSLPCKMPSKENER